MIGSPAYFAPEQIRSENITAKTDQYSLGVMMFEILTGTRPFPDATLSDILFKHLNEPLPCSRTSPGIARRAGTTCFSGRRLKILTNAIEDVLQFAAAFQKR